MKPDVSMKISRGDLAALSFRSRDALINGVSYLEGRKLDEGERVMILIEARVERAPSGALIFGDATAQVRHGL